MALENLTLFEIDIEDGITLFGSKENEGMDVEGMDMEMPSVEMDERDVESDDETSEESSSGMLRLLGMLAIGLALAMGVRKLRQRQSDSSIEEELSPEDEEIDVEQYAD